MHIPNVAISTVVSLVCWGFTLVQMPKVRSQTAPPYPGNINYTLPTETPHKVVYDQHLVEMETPIHSNSSPSEFTPLPNSAPIVRTVEIRFVNGKGEAVDQDGNPIQGRLSPDYITRELQLQPGDVWREEIVRADLQQLKQLGLFERVDVTVVPVNDGVNVVYNIQERSARSLNPGGGYNDDVGVYGTLSYQNLTIGRTHQRVQGNIEVSQDNVDFNAQFVSPYQVAEPDGLGYSIRVFRDRSISDIFNQEIDLPPGNQTNGERVREVRLGGGVSVTRPINQWWGTLGFNATRISTRDRDGNLATIDELGNPLTFSGQGIDDLYTVSVGVTRDWRDNPFNPTRGAILSLSTAQSIPLGVGNIVQNRLVGNYIQYVPVRWLSSDAENARRDAMPEMFAFNLQAGTVIGDLPPTEAFRLGGMNSVRGYNQGDVGSGRSYFLASGEYRFPILSQLGGVIFADFASDLGTADSVPGNPAMVRDKPGIGFGTGVGARWRSPFGILRVDVGINDQGEVQFHTELGTGQRF